jgi:hypothetical protein
MRRDGSASIERIVDIDPYEMPLTRLLPAASLDTLRPWRGLFDNDHVDFATGMLRKT